MKEATEPNDQCHLRGAKTIAKVFGVSRKTVVEWRNMGAPIFCFGKKYQANYLELWEWIKGNSD